MLQSNEIKIKEMKNKLQEEYFTRLKKIMKTSLNSKNTIQAINTFAVPVVTYGFSILDWSVTSLETIDRETRNVLRKYHLLHINSDIDRLYLSRLEGGRGLLNITDLFKSHTIQYDKYLLETQDELLKIVATWQTQRGKKSIHVRSMKFIDELQLQTNEIVETSRTETKNIIKHAQKNRRKKLLKDKKMHSQYIKILEEPHVDTKTSTAWLKSSTLKRATEATICAIQEQAITTKYTRKHIFKTSDDDRCRACKQAPETIHHIISSCSKLAPTKYLQRHNNLCKYIHILLAEKYDFLKEQAIWYKYDPEPYLENEAVKILWDFPVQTDRTVAHNKPDILLFQKTKKKVFLIDIAVPNDENIGRKRNEKIEKYNDLCYEIKELWNVNEVKTVPIIVGATGIIHQKFDKSIYETIGIIVNTREIQKIILLGTANITRYFLSSQF